MASAVGVLRVGLTGGIACGRTTIGGILRERGMLILDADTVAHGLMSCRGEAVSDIAEVFGPEILSSSGEVDRAALARIVFADSDARRRLEAILHPRILETLDADAAAFEARHGSGIVVVDAALMVETGTHGRYHRLVVAHCPPDIQLARLMRRGAIGEADARARIAAQAPLEKKIAVADYLIATGGTMDETRARTLQVAALLEGDASMLPDLPKRPNGAA